MNHKIMIYDAPTGEKVPLVPQAGNKITMYVCGPTVYNYFHIGNARCFTVFDFIRRFLEKSGYDVKYVQNFTDIDDKMIRAAAADKTTVSEVADKFIAEYKTDAAGLGISPADVHPLATEHISQIIGIVSELVRKGHAYPAKTDENSPDSDVYFSVKTFAEYGKLSGMETCDLEAGVRVDVIEAKADSMDFALWKAAKPGEPWWDSPWGKGRPGWHIECSAMAKTHLGDTVDIHCGGQDLTFPHHENEIAQSECANGAKFVRHWLHNGYINIDNKKMGKSEGNALTVRELSAKYGYTAIRFFVLCSHYRSPINFTDAQLTAAASSVERISNCVENVAFRLTKTTDEVSQSNSETIAKFEALREAFYCSLADDFNTADALAALFDLVRELNTYMSGEVTKTTLSAGGEILGEMTALFGFGMPKTETGGEDSETEIDALVAERTAAKTAKNFKLADEIRNKLKEMGVTVEDTAQGAKWKRS